MILVGYLVGSELITIIVNNIPEVIKSGLGQSGNLLPALGIAMLIQITWDKKFGAFLFMGFGLAAFLGVSSIGAATFGLITAVIYYVLSGNKAQPALVNNDESEEL